MNWSVVLKRSFISSYVMSVFTLVAMVISFAVVSMIRLGTSDLGDVIRFSTKGSIAEIVLEVFSLFLLTILPAIWISACDETYFVIFGVFRWGLLGILAEGAGGFISNVIPLPSQSSGLFDEFITFILRIIVGLVIIGVSYWLVFRMPRMVSKGSDHSDAV